MHNFRYTALPPENNVVLAMIEVEPYPAWKRQDTKCLNLDFKRNKDGKIYKRNIKLRQQSYNNKQRKNNESEVEQTPK